MYTTLALRRRRAEVSLEIPKQLIRLAVPLILGNFLQQLYNTIDAFVLAHYADAGSFAAVGIAASVMNLFIFAIVGACAGISVIFSQYFGSGDMEAFRNEHFLTAACGTGIAILLSVISILFLRPLLTLIQVPAQLTAPVHSYLVLILLGLPASYLYNLCNAILRSVNKTGVVLLILFASVLLNIVLAFLFVAYFHAGIRGAACATLFSQIFSAVLGCLYIRKMTPELAFHKGDMYLDASKLTRTAHLAAVTALHQSSLYLGKLLVQGVVNTAGVAAISAYTATTRIEGFANSFGDSGAAATSVVVAQYTGAKNKEKAKSTYCWSMLLLIALGLISSAILFLGATASSAFMLGSANADALQAAVSYLRVIALFYILCFTGNAFVGYLDGIGKVQYPFIGAASHITLRILLSYLLIGRMGLTAVALASGLGWVWANFFWTVVIRRVGGSSFHVK